MFFFKKQKEMRAKFFPNEDGVAVKFFLHEGKSQQVISLPISYTQLRDLYKVPGFSQYVCWEELLEHGYVENNLLPFTKYYELLEDEVGQELLTSLGLPTEPTDVKGKLTLDSLPTEGKLSLHLHNAIGQNLERIGKVSGALVQVKDELHLLPQQVYDVRKNINSTFENGYQKIGVCQKLAQEAQVELEDFLINEQFHVIDEYDMDVKVHGIDHIELVPKGRSEEESFHLNSSEPVMTVKNNHQRNRYVKTQKVQEDMQVLKESRHITGEQVPLFFDNPEAVLPEHDFQLNLEEFSERVKGLIPITKARPSFGNGSTIQWFDENSGRETSLDTSTLRDLMEKYPDKQYVQHEGEWVYLDPSMRRKLMELPEEEEKQSGSFTLDIKGNEDDVEYQLEAEKNKLFQTYPIPNGLQADLFPHQVEGFHWISNLEEKKLGGLLADDMGLGKTIQVITFLLRMKELGRLGPSLIVLPIALIENWQEEIRKFAPSLAGNIYVHRGYGRLRDSNRISQFDIIFTSYDTLKLDQLVLGKIKFRHVICDEAQNAKTHSSQRSRALRALQSDFRLAMTGTPVENSLEELWSIMDFVQPGELGSLRQFKQLYMKTDDYVGLTEKIKPFYLRRTKEEVLKDKLPEKHLLEPIKIQASKVQKDIARSMLVSKETGQVAILNMLMRLRQMYGHPGIIVPSLEYGEVDQAPKLKELLRLIDEVKKKDEKILIFTEFRKMHSILKRTLMERYGIHVPVIDGEVSDRQAVVRMFNQSPGFGIMLLSPKAAGVGLTITSANHVVHYTRWWNPAVENQATDRAYRIGQTKDVYVYQLITTDEKNFPQGTVEELRHQLLEDRRDLANNVIVPFDTKELQRAVVGALMEREEN